MNTTITPSKKVLFSLALLLAALVVQPVQGQTSHQVAVRNNTFTPKELTVTAGDTVIWKCTQGVHNVNGNKSAFPSNPASFGNSLGSNWTYKFIFTLPGVYNYHCDPHVDLGMTGKITVVPKPAKPVLTVAFSGMTPHVGQRFTFYLKESVSGLYRDTVVLNPVPGSMFQIVSDQIVKGMSYNLDFFADHNGNGQYDAPPADHAWRIELNNVTGDTTLAFAHNTNFFNIFNNSSGIGEEALNLQEIQLFPNPATGQITLALSKVNPAGLSLRITSITGAQMLSREVPAGQTSLIIDISDYSGGLYFLTIKTAGEVRTLRFVRQ